MHHVSVASVMVVPAVFPRGNLRDIPAGEKTGREAPGLTNYVAICWLDTDLMRTKVLIEMLINRCGLSG